MSYNFQSHSRLKAKKRHNKSNIRQRHGGDKGKMVKERKRTSYMSMEKRKIEGEMIGVDGYFVHSLNKKQNNFEERQRRHTSSTKSNENFKLELFSMENYM